ncbi:hypothetical protein A2U01_0080808, partial [Trifolium medium]|nr:hypothetical protein [Trifolium medium]
MLPSMNLLFILHGSGYPLRLILPQE